MKNLKYISLIIVVIFVALLAYNHYQDKDKVVKTVKIETTKVVKSDTTHTKKIVKSEPKAVVKYVKIYLPNAKKDSLIEQLKKQIKALKNNLEKVAEWDTSTTNGFVANVKYFTLQDKFVNKFTIPTTTITDSVFVTKTVTTTNNITKYEMPKWQLSAGVELIYLDNKIVFSPFTSLTRNINLPFATISFEGKGLLNFENGSVKMVPKLIGKLSFNL